MVNAPLGAGRWSGWVALAWATAFAYLGLTSDVPRVDVPGLERVDFLGHAGASLLLAVLVGEWLVRRRGRGRRSGLAVAFALTVALGLAIEVTQTRVPARAFETLDVVADVVGAGLGVWAYSLASTKVRHSVLSKLVVAAGVAGLAAVGLLVAVL